MALFAVFLKNMAIIGIQVKSLMDSGIFKGTYPLILEHNQL